MVTVHYQDSNKYAGLIDRSTGQALGQLVRTYPVTLSAFISREFGTSFKSSAEASSKQHCLQVLVYGLEQDSEPIGALLSENCLYLQHPRTYDNSATYFNPHYLARPGRDIQVPDNTVTGAYPNFIQHSQTLDEVDKNRVLQVFDSAQGPERFLEAKVSNRLLTNLKL
jgi:hypothetical protein